MGELFLTVVVQNLHSGLIRGQPHTVGVGEHNPHILSAFVDIIKERSDVHTVELTETGGDKGHTLVQKYQVLPSGGVSWRGWHKMLKLEHSCRGAILVQLALAVDSLPVMSETCPV